MYNQENNEITKDVPLLKLKFENIDEPIKAIIDKQNETELTVVCPFPVLNVDLPVKIDFASASNVKFSGKVQRLGIAWRRGEIPQLKLKIKIEDENDVIEKNEGIIEVNEPFEVPDTPTDPQSIDEISFPVFIDTDIQAKPEENIDNQEPVQNNSESKTPEFNLGTDSIKHLNNDPPWTKQNTILTEQLELKTNRKKRSSGKFIVMFILFISLLAAGFIFRINLINLIKSTGDNETENGNMELLTLTKELNKQIVNTPQVEPVENAQNTEQLAQNTQNTPSTDEQNTAAVIPSEDNSLETQINANGDNPEKLLLNEAASQENNNEIAAQSAPQRLVIPLRWPPTKISSYRTIDPVGLVIDVYGSVATPNTVKRLMNNDIIKGVKVINREDGERFIIYFKEATLRRYRIGNNYEGVVIDLLDLDPRFSTNEWHASR